VFRAIADWIATTPLGTVLQTPLGVVPTSQSLHILGACLVLAFALMSKLRLLGVGAEGRPASQLCRRLLPWICSGLAALQVRLAGARSWLRLAPHRVAMMSCSGLLLSTVMALAHGLAAKSEPNWKVLNPVTELSTESFANPGLNDRPWVRLNMPASADPKELMAEVAELYRSGVAGIEVGQGAFPTNEQLVAILTEANQLGIKVSLSHGPTQYPTDYSIDDENARKTLAFGNVTLEPGARVDGDLPAPRPPVPLRFRIPGGRVAAAPPAPAPGSTPKVRSTLIAVLAYRCSMDSCPQNGVSMLDPTSVIDLTSLVSGTNTAGVRGGTTAGTLHWAPPEALSTYRWQVIAFWARGVFAQPDPFSPEGFRQLVQSLRTGLSPQVQALMRLNGGDIFYDSHTADRGSPDELWTNDMPQQFLKRAGYSLLPRLAALFPEAFTFSDGSAARVRNDLYAVRGDLWINTQLMPLEDWAHTLGYALRVQPEGEMSPTIPISDQVKVTSILDRPEHESLFTNDEVDNYLPIASANHMTGNPWYSTECCAALNLNYAQTLQDLTIRMHRSFAGGITKLVYHVYPYRDSASSKWPGYHNFGQAGFSNAWGPRDPDWIDARIYNDYLARLSQVLTQGTAQVDVAVYMQNYLYPQPQMIEDGSGFRIWRDTRLPAAGFTRDYLDPEMLDSPNAIVKGGLLAAGGPAYKALVIDGELQPASDPDKRSMPLETAQRILGYARSGLPVLIVARPPDHVPGNAPQQDQQLKEVVAALLKEANVHQVPHESGVPGQLLSLGIRPSAQPSAPCSLLSVHRRDTARRTDYYYLYNQGVVSPAGEPANLFAAATGVSLHTEITLVGHGRPFLLDAWAGRITPIAKYRVNGDRITLDLQLARDDAMVIALSEERGVVGQAFSRVHVTHTTADGAIQRGQSLLVRASRSGAYTTKLSNGQTVHSRVQGDLESINLTGSKWQLTVQDWQPASPYATTTGPAATETVKPEIHVELRGLKPWLDMAQLQHTSGVGQYTMAFDLPARWTSADGATLALGTVLDSFELAVNGQRVPVDQLSAESDVGPYLKAGRNVLSVRVATTLNNRLALIDDDVRARGVVQAYGLIGPVVLRPYREMVVFRDPAKPSRP